MVCGVCMGGEGDEGREWVRKGAVILLISSRQEREPIIACSAQRAITCTPSRTQRPVCEDHFLPFVTVCFARVREKRLYYALPLTRCTPSRCFVTWGGDVRWGVLGVGMECGDGVLGVGW